MCLRLHIQMQTSDKEHCISIKCTQSTFKKGQEPSSCNADEVECHMAVVLEWHRDQLKLQYG